MLKINDDGDDDEASFILEYVIILSCWAVIWSVDVTNEKCLWRDNSLLDHYYYGCVVTTDGCCYMSVPLLCRTHSKSVFRCAHEFLYRLQWGQLCSFYICSSRLSTFDSIHWHYVYVPFCVIDTECDPLICTWIAYLFLVVNDTEMKIVINWINCSESNLPPPSSTFASSCEPMKNFIRHLFWAKQMYHLSVDIKNQPHVAFRTKNSNSNVSVDEHIASTIRMDCHCKHIWNKSSEKSRFGLHIHASMVPSLTFDKSVNDTQSSLSFK